MELLWAGGLTDVIYKTGGGRGWGPGSEMFRFIVGFLSFSIVTWGWIVLSRGRLFCVVGCLAASWPLPSGCQDHSPRPPPGVTTKNISSHALGKAGRETTPFENQWYQCI